ncbi:transcription termination factor MTEF1, chloroplastic [Zea mays]|uniref:Transcription termination factor MTEF1, chloroplastic n=2 Tax=Zea mays TaxID=4577 RepID=A0A804LKP7_MAIZE|nr:transcription termination factor MTEF1, chloroplastic [Zea mays]|eukprot:XP_008655967.1 transcription termination factor MTEF1, chloroplastic [Zea mays]
MRWFDQIHLTPLSSLRLTTTEKKRNLRATGTMAATRTALALLGHEGMESGPRPAAPRRSRLRVVAVALRTRPTSLAAPGLPPAAPEPVLPSPPVAAGAAAVLLEAGVPPADLRRAAGMCPELLSVSAEAVEAALRFLTEEAGVAEADLPRVLRRRPRLLVSPVAARLRPTLYFLRALGVPDLHRRADLLSFSVEGKLLPRLEFLESLGLPARAARSMARRFPALFGYGVEGNMRPKADYLLGAMARRADELYDFPEYFSYALATRIVPRYEACAARGVSRLPLPAMLRPGDAKFRSTLTSCVGSMLPRRRSALWHATWVDDDAAAAAAAKETTV